MPGRCSREITPHLSAKLSVKQTVGKISLNQLATKLLRGLMQQALRNRTPLGAMWVQHKLLDVMETPQIFRLHKKSISPSTNNAQPLQRPALCPTELSEISQSTHA